MTTNSDLRLPPPPPPIPATTLGSIVDSFYRSSMNAFLNARLTNTPITKVTGKMLFPNMHIQIPSRILYINGIKQVRADVDKWKYEYLVRRRAQLQVSAQNQKGQNAEKESGKGQKDGQKGVDYVEMGVDVGCAVFPGVAMTPLSSLLEASNAGHMNKESMSTRWMRGYLPRTVREIIFAIGLNQLSDKCQTIIPTPTPTTGQDYSTFRNVAGSMLAGVLAGYLSHIPHNLSALKLLRPQLSYSTLLNGLIDERMKKYPSLFNGIQSEGTRWVVGLGMVLVAPKGVMVRTGQIVGTFIIINGTIGLMARYGGLDKFRSAATGNLNVLYGQQKDDGKSK